MLSPSVVALRMVAGDCHDAIVPQRGSTDAPPGDGGGAAVLLGIRRDQLLASAAAGERQGAGEGGQAGADRGRGAERQTSGAAAAQSGSFPSGRL